MLKGVDRPSLERDRVLCELGSGASFSYFFFFSSVPFVRGRASLFRTSVAGRGGGGRRRKRHRRGTVLIRVYRATTVRSDGITRFSRYSLVAYFITRVETVREGRKPIDRRREVTTITEEQEEPPRLLPPRLPFSSAEGGASRAARLCARSGDRRRDEDNRAVSLLSLLSLRGYIVADELLPAAWCSRTRGRIEVDREEEERRERVRKRTTRNSRWV